jgi:hypothetical protein
LDIQIMGAQLVLFVPGMVLSAEKTAMKKPNKAPAVALLFWWGTQ